MDRLDTTSIIKLYFLSASVKHIYLSCVATSCWCSVECALHHEQDVH